MKPTDLHTLAYLLLDLQDVIKDSHHHPILENELDNQVIKAYAATVELFDFVSEEIAALEKAGILEAEKLDPIEEEVFALIMERAFQSNKNEPQFNLQLDEHPDDMVDKIINRLETASFERQKSRWNGQSEVQHQL